MQLFFHASLLLLGAWQLRAAKHGSTVRYVSTIWYASIFAKKHGTFVRNALFVKVRVPYVDALFECAY